MKGSQYDCFVFVVYLFAVVVRFDCFFFLYFFLFYYYKERMHKCE
jgi:hypothetical protein